MAILIPVEDRVSTYPGRIKLTPVSGQTNVYDMSRADGAVQEGTPLNKALLDQKAYTLTEDVTVYVSPSGSDAEGDGSAVAPFATIQAALDALPRILGSHTATIDIAAGTYDERIKITGFSGGNLIVGKSGRNVVVRGIVVTGSSHVTVNISNITWAAGFSGTLFLVTHNSAVALGSNLNVQCSGSGEVGIDVTYGSELFSVDTVVTVSNCAKNAIRTTYGSKATFYSIAGSGNADLGLLAEKGGILSYESMSLSSSKGDIARTGGRIRDGSGVELSPTDALNESKSYADSLHKTFTVSVPASGWSASAPYTQSITVSGIMATDTPHYSVVYSSSITAKIAEKEAFAMVDDLDTANNRVTFTCFEDKPSTSLTIQLEVNR